MAGKQIIHVNEIPFLEGSENRHEIKNLLDDRLTHFVIGPEGDFSDSEIKFLSNIKWGCMNRSTILRSETALLAIAAQLQDRWLPSLHLFSEGIHE